MTCNLPTFPHNAVGKVRGGTRRANKRVRSTQRSWGNVFLPDALLLPCRARARTPARTRGGMPLPPRCCDGCESSQHADPSILSSIHPSIHQSNHPIHPVHLIHASCVMACVMRLRTAPLGPLSPGPARRGAARLARPGLRPAWLGAAQASRL